MSNHRSTSTAQARAAAPSAVHPGHQAPRHESDHRPLPQVARLGRLRHAATSDLLAVASALGCMVAMFGGCSGESAYTQDSAEGCQSNAQCPSGQVCLDRACVQCAPPCDEAGCACAADADCGQGLRCVGEPKVCARDACGPDAPCPQGQRCDQGRCAEAPAAEAAPDEAAPAEARARVTLGIDRLLGDEIALVEGRRVGVITNTSGVDGALAMTADRLIDDPRVKVVQLYSPEHGLGGFMRNGQSDKEEIYEYGGQKIPVQGLTGERWQPSPESMRRLDVLIFDIQDIGSRTYTYVSTLGLAMQAAAAAKKPIIVLDRPNPLGGLRFEGPVRLDRYKTFIGWGPLPVTHGMTVGELARFYNEELKIKADLRVVQMRGWTRDMIWQDTGLEWVPTSPGIPHPHNAQLYVATGMVGGSGPNVNEGGGNSQPFELIGALFVDNPRLLAERLNAAALPGVHFRPLIYKPWGRQFKDKEVGGVQLMLRDPRAHRPLRTALTILVTLRALYGDALTVSNPKRFARVWGNDWIWPMITEGRSVDEIEARWADELAAFGQKRSKHLIYPAP